MEEKQIYVVDGTIKVVRLVEYTPDKETMVFRDLEKGEVFTSHSTHVYWNERRMELIRSVTSPKRSFFLVKFGYANSQSSQVDAVAFSEYRGFTSI